MSRTCPSNNLLHFRDFKRYNQLMKRGSVAERLQKGFGWLLLFGFFCLSACAASQPAQPDAAETDSVSARASASGTEEAKPLLPEETEVADVLGQVETAARRNGVTLTGLMAVKESIKSPKAAKLYEREIPAVVTGPYPQVVKFFGDISRMPRILLVRDFSVGSMRSTVSAGFTLVAYHAPPPAEMPPIPADLAQDAAQKEVSRQ